MALSKNEVKRAVTALWQEASPEWQRIGKFRRYMAGHAKRPWLPENAESEYLDIARKSASNWLHLVVNAAADGLLVSGYGDSEGGSTLWDDAWQANGMDARSDALHHAALTLGYSYMIVLPGEADDETDNKVYMRPEAATNLYAKYENPDDEYPKIAVRRTWYAPGKFKWEIYDEGTRYDYNGTNNAAEDQIGSFKHDLGLCPVVKLSASENLMGNPVGEVEPLTPIQDRIIDATFSLQMVAKYGAFPQRWIAGMSAADTADDELAPKIRAYVDHILMAADPDTKFGQFAAADLGQYAVALETHVRHLAAISQTPPHYLLGEIINVSADAVAAAEAGFQRKENRRKRSLGEGWEQTLRLSAQVLGDDTAATDRSSQIEWANTETRALGQVADAIQKLAAVNVPMDILLKLLPGVSKTDVDAALTKIEEEKAKQEKLAQEQADKVVEAAKAQPPDKPVPPTPAKPPAPTAP